MKFFLVSLLLVLGFTGAAPMAFAASATEAVNTPQGPITCSAGCWCAGPGGAKKIEGVSSDTCANRCKTDFKDSGGNVIEYRAIGCATNPSGTPQYNLRCFKKDDVTDQKICTDTLKGMLLTSEQPEECVPNSVYCVMDPNRPDAYKTTLNVPIGAMKDTRSIADYFANIYNYLLGIAAVIVTVMFIIGGFQYMLSALSSAQAAKGKERMKTSAIGFALLMSAYLILQTVSPATLKMRLPTLPKTKPLGALLENASCERLHDKLGYKLQPKTAGKTACGDVGTMTADPNGTPLADQTCMYSDCRAVGIDARCLPNAKGGGDCVKCGDVTPANFLSSGIQPSSSVCTALKLPDDAANNIKNYCFYTHDTSMIISGYRTAWTFTGTVVGGVAGFVLPVPGGAYTGTLLGAALTGPNVSDINMGTCAEMALECNGIGACEQYDVVDVVNATTDDGLEEVEDPSGKVSGIFFGGDMTLSTICNDDPCGVGGCRMEGLNDCVSTSDESQSQQSDYDFYIP